MTTPVRLGLRANLAQFSLLVLVNAFVGAMIGMERSILPAIAQEEFHLAAKTAVISFIVVFGVTKAITNYLAGRLSDRFGRKHVLVGGWIIAAPVPFLLMWAPTWNWVLVANVLLGVSQGLTWSTTVIMKIDLAGPERRGLAMGLNEFAGYFAVAGSALATGFVAAHYGLRPQPFYLGVGFVAFGLLLSALMVRETNRHALAESKLHGELPSDEMPSQREIFWRTTLFDKDLSSVSQAGLVNNLNDGMAWGLFPLFFAAAHMDIRQIGTLAAIYPATWGMAQLFTGAWSDRVGRKWLIATGMWVQATGIAVVILSGSFAGFAVGAGFLGIGTAMVYPTLLAAIGDVAHPSWRASSVGVYRLWRDLGYAIGALLAGALADALGLPAAMWFIAALTFRIWARRSFPHAGNARWDPDFLSRRLVMERTLSSRTCHRLDIQGFDGVERNVLAQVAPWLRLAFGLCTSLAAVGTVTASPAILLALTPIAALGAALPVHPFDLIYNYGIRHLTGTGPLPKRGAPTRFACGIATPWLLGTAWAFSAGHSVLGYALGGSLAAVGTLVSTTDICIPSIIYRSLFGAPRPRDASNG